MGAPDEMTAHRRDRLRDFLDQLEARSETERRAYVIARGTKKSRLAQLLKDGFGERAGVTLATRLGLRNKRAFDLPRGSPFDAPSPSLHAREPLPAHAPANRSEVTLVDAVRMIAETVMALPESRREAASNAIRLLASAPDQWAEIAKMLNSFAPPLGGVSSIRWRGSANPKGELNPARLYIFPARGVYDESHGAKKRE